MEQEIKFLETDNIESVVYTLLAAKARGEKVWGDFEGHIFHSDAISMNSAYMEVYGCTKAEYYKKNDYINDLIQRGKTLMFPERYDEWEKCANSNPGYELKSALDIMQTLENGASIEETEKMFERQEHSGFAAAFVRDVVFLFSRRGPEFWKATAHGKIAPETMLILEEKRQENIRLAQEHANKNNDNGMHK